MASLISFESNTDKEKRRAIRRNQREAILAKVEADFNKNEKKRKKAELEGERSWMLTSVEDRIKNEEKEIENALKRKGKKKDRKEKKEKKHKGRRKSSSETDEQQKWVEKTMSSTIGPHLQRQDWMMMEDFSLISTKKDKDKKQTIIDEKIGCHDRELNPYWKDGGSGLPTLNSEEISLVAIGDRGVSWLRKALQRCVEKAKEEKRTLEEVAAERYGSLDELKLKIEAAENEERAEMERERKKRRKKEEEEENQRRFRSHIPTHISKRFKQPQNDVDQREENRNSGLESSSKSCSWRKPGFKVPADDKSEKQHRNDYDDDDDGKIKRQKKKKETSSSFRKSQSSSSDDENQRQRNEKNQTILMKEEKTKTESSDDSESEEKINESSMITDESNASNILTEEEMNKLGAQILRAELFGDELLFKSLKKQMEDARKAKDTQITKSISIKKKISKDDDNDDVTLLTRTKRSGITHPLNSSAQFTTEDHLKGRRKQKSKKIIITHDKSGKREKYFEDDDKYTIKDLVEREKLNTAEDANMMFARLAGRGSRADDEDLDDNMIDSSAFENKSQSFIESRERQMTIIENKKMSSSLDKCLYCFSNIPKHLIVAVGVKVYLCLPKHKLMVDGHCLIVPIQHITQGTVCDEDVWDEIKIFRKGLTKMFEDCGCECVFMETSFNLKRFPHMTIECIPIEKEIGEMAPIYFKKALQECDTEWSDNKKIVDLSQKDIRHAVPKGFPYFSVDFGLDGGFAHVIEDEKSFSSYFGREIIGGMLSLEPGCWRRPHNESFELQRKKVLSFEQKWKPYDWTQKLS